MKLLDRLQSISEDEMIYCGCKGGSGFFFVGTRAEFYELIDRIDEDFRKELQKSIDRKIKSQKTLNENIETLSADYEFCKSQEQDARNELVKGLENVFDCTALEKAHLELIKKCKQKQTTLTKKEKEYKSGQDILDQKVTDLREWEVIPDREIVEEYPHHVDVPGITLLVSGRQEGRFWSRDEFLEGVKKYE